jgi:hypothetical protein
MRINDEADIRSVDRKINLDSTQATGLNVFVPMDDLSGNYVCDYANKDFYQIIYSYGSTVGPMGPCMSFDQVNYVNLGSSNKVKPNNITINIWAIVTRDALQVLIGRRKDSASVAPASYGLSYRGSGVMYFTIANSSSTEAAATSSNVILNKIQMWTGTFDGSTIRLYLNGIEQTPSNYSGNILYSNDYTTAIGVYPYFTSFNFQGLAWDARIYNRALSQSDIMELYTNPDGIWLKDEVFTYTQQFKPWFAQPSIICQ